MKARFLVAILASLMLAGCEGMIVAGAKGIDFVTAPMQRAANNYTCGESVRSLEAQRNSTNESDRPALDARLKALKAHCGM